MKVTTSGDEALAHKKTRTKIEKNKEGWGGEGRGSYPQEQFGVCPLRSRGNVSKEDQSAHNSKSDSNQSNCHGAMDDGCSLGRRAGLELGWGYCE